eukprot:scaffold21610_cov21-Tisochrysis_lutea.AAC.1
MQRNVCTPYSKASMNDCTLYSKAGRNDCTLYSKAGRNESTLYSKAGRNDCTLYSKAGRNDCTLYSKAESMKGSGRARAGLLSLHESVDSHFSNTKSIHKVTAAPVQAWPAPA